MQVRRLDHVMVNQPDSANAGASQVRSGGTPEAADADDEHSGALETELAFAVLDG